MDRLPIPDSTTVNEQYIQSIKNLTESLRDLEETTETKSLDDISEIDNEDDEEENRQLLFDREQLTTLDLKCTILTKRTEDLEKRIMVLMFVLTLYFAAELYYIFK